MRRRHFLRGLCACCGSLGMSQLLGATREIKKGDTLFSISRQCEVSVADLMKANPGIDPTKLKPGQVLQIPDKEPSPPVAEKVPPAPAKNETPAGTASENTAVPGNPPVSSDESATIGKKPTPTPQPSLFHTVAKGDTLFGISRKYDLTVAELRRLNPDLTEIITPGQQIRVRSAVTTPGIIDTGPPPDAPLSPPPPKKPAPPPEQAEKPPTPQYVFITGRTKKNIDKPKIKDRIWRYIVLHHSGTHNGNAKIFDYYHRRIRGMENGLAYHFVIGNGTDSGDGEIEVGDRWFQQLQGGHVRSEAQNEVAIGICLVGDFQRKRPTRRQVSSLIELIGYLQRIVGDPKPRLYLHRDINIISTDCPGDNFPATALYRLFGGKPPRPKE